MENKELIKKIESTNSVYDLFNMKQEILDALRGKEKKKKKEVKSGGG